VLANLRPNCNARRDVRDVRAVHLRSSFRPVSVERERETKRTRLPVGRSLVALYLTFVNSEPMPLCQ
jgi:hypothetical protein